MGRKKKKSVFDKFPRTTVLVGALLFLALLIVPGVIWGTQIEQFLDRISPYGEIVGGAVLIAMFVGYAIQQDLKGGPFLFR